MGKGSGGAGARWALLLVAGVLLAAAATAAAEEDVGSEVAAAADRDPKEDLRWCRKGCRWQYGQDARRRAECERECRERGENEDEDADALGGFGRGECRRRCARCYKDQPWWVAECVS